MTNPLNKNKIRKRRRRVELDKQVVKNETNEKTLRGIFIGGMVSGMRIERGYPYSFYKNTQHSAWTWKVCRNFLSDLDEGSIDVEINRGNSLTSVEIMERGGQARSLRFPVSAISITEDDVKKIFQETTKIFRTEQHRKNEPLNLPIFIKFLIDGLESEIKKKPYGKEKSEATMPESELRQAIKNRSVQLEDGKPWPHPGALMVKVIEDQKLTVYAAAHKIGVNRVLLHNVVKGERSLNNDMAAKFAANFSQYTEDDLLWVQMKYDQYCYHHPEIKKGQVANPSSEPTPVF